MENDQRAMQNEIFQLTPGARPFVLYQRTELLPPRTPPTLLEKLLRKVKLADDGYKKFVERHANNAGESIDAQYSAIMREKAEALIPHIPSDAASLLDIGCGIAALDYYLFRHLNDPNLFLLDRTETEDQIFYMYKPSGAFYNSLELAEELLVKNGVPRGKVTKILAPDDGVIELPDKSLDVVISTISWGFHYPVETYLESVRRILSDRGVLLIDVRKRTGGQEALETYFDCEVVEDYRKHVLLRCTLK